MNTNWEKKAKNRRNLSLLLSVLAHVLVISWIWYSHINTQTTEDEIDKIENTISESREAFLES